MLTLNATSLRHSTHEASAPPAQGTDPAGFASLLRQTQVAPMPAVAAPPAPQAATTEPKPASGADASGPDSAAPTEAEEPRESDPTVRTRALLKGKARATDGAGPAQRDGKAHVQAHDAAKSSANDPVSPDRRAEAGTPAAGASNPALDPGLLHWLADLHRVAAAAGDAGGSKRGADTATATDASAQGGLGDTPDGRAHARSGSPGAIELKAAADLKDEAARAQASLADASSAGRFAEALAGERPVDRAATAPTSGVGGTPDPAAAMAAALAPSSAAAAGTAAPAVVAVATPVNAPDFAQALGLSLSVLARDGVQQAELHLNPADMGPVSVQIVMEGTRAHVDFGADVAATRQAIEAGLPELASALRDAGFTLAGGGVSQHAGGRGDSGSANPQGDPGRPRSVGADGVQRVASAARRIVTAGGVDLFA